MKSIGRNCHCLSPICTCCAKDFADLYKLKNISIYDFGCPEDVHTVALTDISRTPRGPLACCA